MDKKRQGVLCFLRKDKQILLALIKYPSGEKLWTGLGGFVESGESSKDAACREISEETFIKLSKQHLVEAGEVKINSKLVLSIFFADSWQGVIKAKEPSIRDLQWFCVDKLPYSKMHSGTKNWLPKLLEVRR